MKNNSYKLVNRPPEPNDSNVDEVIKMVEANSPDCVEINFNNIQVRGDSLWQKNGSDKKYFFCVLLKLSFNGYRQ
jgi:hypothetical protein